MSEKRRIVEDPLIPSTHSGEPEKVYDDKVLDRAFRWSLITMGALVLIAGVGILFLTLRGKSAKTQVTRLSAPQLPAATLAEVPNAPFKNITAEAGIRFVHHN